MTYILATCPYCEKTKPTTASKTSWMIHLYGHRENIIKHITDQTSACVFCAYSEIFANKKHASSHYRWAHKKSTLTEWALNNMPSQIIV